MLTFPIKNAAIALKGKPPEELPHGRLAVPPEVRELIERERAKHPPELFAKNEVRTLNLWTVGWYFDDLGHGVVYRETPEGPEVLAVGREEVAAYRESVPHDERPADIKTYRTY